MPKICTVVLAKNFALSLPKNCTLVSPLLNGAEFTLSVAKNVALFETVPILLFASVKWRDRGSKHRKKTIEFPTAPSFFSSKKMNQIKGALSRYSVILCRFFAVENGGEETRGRGAGQREAGLCSTFFLHQFRASRSIDVGVSVSYPCKVIPLSDEDGL